MKTVIYTRVSTEEQKKYGYSLLEQEKRLREYCLANSYEVIAHYQDDHSAKNFNRPQFQMFLNDLQKGKIKPDVLLVTKSDRFARNVFEAYAQIEALNAVKIKVGSISDGIFDFKNPHKFFPNLIQFGAAHHDNILKADNTVRGMRQAMRLGRWVWNAPVGYTNDKLNSLIPNEKAPLVKQAFELMSTGLYSADEIRKKIWAQGAKITKQAFLNMLRNKLYYGEIEIKEWQNEPSEIVRGIHEPIITQEVFQKVQEVLISRKRNWPKTQNINHNLPLRGYLICKSCGNNLTGSGSISRNKSVHYYYHCQNGCKERYRADLANSHFVLHLKDLEVPTEIARLYFEILQDVFSQDELVVHSQLLQLDKSIAQTKLRIQTLTDNYLDGNISQNDFNENNTRYKGELKDLISEHFKLSGDKTSFEKYLKFGISMLPDISKYYDASDITAKREIIGSIFPEKMTFDGKSYRTSRINSLFSMIPATGKALADDKMKKAGKISSFLKDAPPSGLEPETP